MLDVVDLDDGSLQDLWSAALAGDRPRQARSSADAPAPEDLSRWEARLARQLPYAPLLTRVQPCAARGEAGSGLVQRICPACGWSWQPPRAGE